MWIYCQGHTDHPQASTQKQEPLVPAKPSDLQFCSLFVLIASMSDPLQWFDHNADNPPFLKALAEVRQLAPREGWRYQHVQAIIVAIDQYAEAALGNRDYFLNRPVSIGAGGAVISLEGKKIPGKEAGVERLKL
jgi:hypothetical protein